MRMFESGEKAGSFWVSYLILSVAGIAEGVSFVRALRQTRAGAREAGMRLLEFVRWSKEPTTKTVFSEDAAALVGLVLASGGILLQQLTGSHAGMRAQRSSSGCCSSTSPSRWAGT